VSLIVAMATNRVIGSNGTLPWHLPADLRRFRAETMGHHIVMGRSTFESIGRPLPGRTSIVLTRDPSASFPGVLVAHSLPEALEQSAGDRDVFVIGGEQVFRAALPIADRILLTEVRLDVGGDTVFPDLEPGAWTMVSSEPLPDPVLDATFSVLERRRD
jgi:dihydrofolate reductase